MSRCGRADLWNACAARVREVITRTHRRDDLLERFPVSLLRVRLLVPLDLPGSPRPGLPSATLRLEGRTFNLNVDSGCRFPDLPPAPKSTSRIPKIGCAEVSSVRRGSCLCFARHPAELVGAHHVRCGDARFPPWAGVWSTREEPSAASRTGERSNCGESFSAHVGAQDRHALGVDDDDIVQVTADDSRGLVHRSQPHTRWLRQRQRKQRLLNLPRNVELVLQQLRTTPLGAARSAA
jgi:hypothetical protein